MRIGIISPPFIPVPPPRYGGTELFIAALATTLHQRGHQVTVYANGASRLPCRVKWRYPAAEWPLSGTPHDMLKNLDHSAWAVREAAEEVDVLHLNDAMQVPFSLFLRCPALLTIHHPHEPELTELYSRYPDVEYVAIGAWQKQREPMPRVSVVHHGIDLDHYRFRAEKDDYFAFLGRMAPCKAPHLAIEAARRAGVRLKLAGEIQPTYRDYWDQQVAPHLDGSRIEYIGEADPEVKNELLSRARALVFPIQWEEPFGLVMVEAMACGTPVIAFAGGAVEEIVAQAETGWICRDLDEMAARLKDVRIGAATCRQHVERLFSVSRMADEYLKLYTRLLEEGRAWKT